MRGTQVPHFLCREPFGKAFQEKEWGKAVQDTIVFDHPNGKKILGMKEVEPPQDMDITDFDSDPNMLIWKAVKEEIQQKYDRPEEDKDALYHSFDIKHTADAQPEQPENYFQLLEHNQVRMYDKPEEDRDDLYHSMFDVAEEPMREEKDITAGNVKPMYSSPEMYKDDLYHVNVKDISLTSRLCRLIYSLFTRVHAEPEVDLDDLYHKQ